MSEDPQSDKERYIRVAAIVIVTIHGIWNIYSMLWEYVRNHRPHLTGNKQKHTRLNGSDISRRVTPNQYFL